MSENLDKMMEKLKKSKEDPVEEEDQDDEEDDVEEEEEEETPKETPKEDNERESIEQEIAILQNTGIYRREKILIARENTEINKVIAQALIEINKSIKGLKQNKR